MKGITNWVASANFDMTLPHIPGRPFFDIASVAGNKTYFDFGIKKSFGPLSIIIPIYQSWEADHTFVNNIDWIKDRIRFSLTIGQFNIRDLF